LEKDEQLESHTYRSAAKWIYENFVSYDNNFRAITRKAKFRFETRDWLGARTDLSQRIDLYDNSVQNAVNGFKEKYSEAAPDMTDWDGIQSVFWNHVTDIPHGQFAKTFFNSVYRTVLHEEGKDPRHISDTSGIVSSLELIKYQAKIKYYLNWGGIREMVYHLFSDFKFNVAFVDLADDVDFVCQKILNAIPLAKKRQSPVIRIEVLEEVFYQSSRAFIIGKIFSSNSFKPFIIAMEHTEEGIKTEAVLNTVDETSVLFGFTRSYFMVDMEPVEGVVHFITSLIPQKPTDELHTILGRARQGKTERARLLYTHLAKARKEDKFEHARGERGLVMLVFTMPSYDLVFKILRDSFGHPKTITHSEVKKKYQFVYKHDRAGRLIDTQEFRNIEFPLKQFSKPLLEELLRECAETVTISGEKLIIEHLYSERRLIPLNLFIKNNDLAKSAEAILDYGQAIKDLALTNIFPGDLLIKNFGVSRRGRVIFYDYDELTLLTNCTFKDIPEPIFPEDDLRSKPWFHVDKTDIFPQEFTKFIGLNSNLKSKLIDAHPEIFTSSYWNSVKQLHIDNLAPEIAPYYRITSRRQPAS
jgi:isocitrate dehydrogenase kinase/phosphatase